ncbi:hypothetical protein ABXS69_10525 [Actinomyces timonensis]|uniref:Uncharacterized protein n=1 Tax=Actinomyces timonensis TaxID=1288391 RepID=A0AAU8N126_9ACTO
MSADRPPADPTDRPSHRRRTARAGLPDLSQPTRPCAAIQGLMAAETEARRLAAGPAPALADGVGAPAVLRSALADIVERLAPEILSLSHDLHAHPEVGYQEHHAMAAVAGLLRVHGIEPDLGVFGMETALRASIGPVAPVGVADGVADAAGGAPRPPVPVPSRSSPSTTRCRASATPAVTTSCAPTPWGPSSPWPPSRPSAPGACRAPSS